MLESRLAKEIRQDKGYKIAMVMNGVLSFITSFFQAYFLAAIVNGVFLASETFAQQAGRITGLAGALLLRTLSSWLFDLYFRRMALKIRTSLVRRYIASMAESENVQEQAQSTGAKSVTVCETAEYTEPYFHEYIPQLYNLMLTVPLILVSVVFFDWLSFLIMLVTAPLLPFFLSLIGRVSGQMNTKRISGMKRLGGSFLDILNGMKTLKLFGQSRAYRKKVFESSEEFRKLTMEVLRVSFLSAFVLELAATISTALIAVSLGLRLIYGRMEFFDAFLILLLTPDFYMAIRKFGAKFHVSQAAKSAADALYGAAGQETAGTGSGAAPSAAPGAAATIMPSMKGNSPAGLEVHFKNVSVQYPRAAKPALDCLDLTIPRGSMTALVGMSGAGKSTIANVLMKFVQIRSGSILVDGIGLHDIGPEEIRKQIAYIPQKPFVFKGTLLENIRLSDPEASMDRVWHAVGQAALTDFIKRLPDGLDTVVSEKGSSLSIGEIQRLSFARAILKDAPLVIIDEGTSALDNENEKLLQEAFESLRRDRTVLIIAHRLDTVRHADTIHVIEDGCAIESGTHEELLAHEGKYRQLVGTWG